MAWESCNDLYGAVAEPGQPERRLQRTALEGSQIEGDRPRNPTLLYELQRRDESLASGRALQGPYSP